MKPFTSYKIILLLFVFSINNAYAVKTATVETKKTEAIASIPKTKTVQENPRKAKRKSKLIKKLKEKFAYIFSKDNVQENTTQGENIETKTHELAIASVILGVIGILTAVWGIGFLFALLALIFGAISRRKIKNSGGFYTGRGLAITGFVLGIVPFTVLFFLLIIVLVNGGF